MKTINKLGQTEMGYIAGMLDADGCIGIARQKSRSNSFPYDFKIRVIITNTNFDLIEWLQKTIGAGHAYFTEYQYKPMWSRVHRYTVTSDVARQLLKQITHLLIVKRERAEIALTLPVNGRERKSRGKLQYIQQEKIFWQMKVLNDRQKIKESI